MKEILNENFSSSYGEKTQDMNEQDYENVSDVRHVPLAEEYLVADVSEQEKGVVRLTKRVEMTPVEETFDLRSDDVSIERRPRNEVVEVAQGPSYEGDTLVIPVYEERVFVETRLVLTEEILVATRTKTEQVTASETIRREVVDISTEHAR